MSGPLITREQIRSLEVSDIAGLICQRKQTMSLSLQNGEINEEERTVVFSVSSENPVERWYGHEILDHGRSAIDDTWLEDGALLYDHRDHIGIIQEHQIKERRLFVKVRFSRNQLAEEKFIDVKDGILKKASLRYKVGEVKLEKEDENGDTYRVKRWTPLEVTLCGIPADPSVGVGRSLDTGTAKKIQEILSQRTVDPTPVTITEEPEPMPDPVRTEVSPTHSVQEIITLGKQFNCEDLALDAISRNLNKQDFAKEIMERQRTTEPVPTTSPKVLGLTAKEKDSFSFRKAILAAHKLDWSDAGFEQEVSEEAKKLYKKEESRNIVVPHEVFSRDADSGGNVHVSTGEGTNVSELVASRYRDQDFISLLKASLLIRQLGARILSGITGEIAIPKAKKAVRASFVNENEDVERTLMQFSQVPFKPKTVAAHSGFTTKLLVQNSLDVEQLIKDDIVSQIRLKIDEVTLTGSGEDPEPMGLLTNAGKENGILEGSWNPEKIWESIVDMETRVATANADQGRLAYVTTPGIRGLLKSKPKEKGQAIYMWESNNSVNSYPAYATNLLPSGPKQSLIFGDWSQVILAIYSTLEMVVDPYTLAQGNKIRVVSRQEVDLNRRYNESFCANKDIPVGGS